MNKRIGYLIIIVVAALVISSVINLALDISNLAPSQQDENIMHFVISVVLIAVGILFLFIRDFVKYYLKKRNRD